MAEGGGGGGGENERKNTWTRNGVLGFCVSFFFLFFFLSPTFSSLSHFSLSYLVIFSQFFAQLFGFFFGYLMCSTMRIRWNFGEFGGNSRP